MSSENVQALNELFLHKLDAEQEKVAAEAGAFIRQKLREVAFSRKIINPIYVTKNDLQRSVNHDGLVKIVDKEPDSKATAINFRGGVDTNYVEGERFEIPFYMISSDDFQKTEEELLAYEMPLTTVIEQNSVKDIQKIEDSGFIGAVDAAIVASGKTTVQTGMGAGLITAAMFTTLFNQLDVSESNPLKADTILMSVADWNKLIQFPGTSVGDEVASEITVNGYTYQTLFGKKLVVTNKVEYVPEKRVYIFTSEEFLGKFYILNDTKFWVEKKKNLVTWSAYESLGMAIGNNEAAAEVTWTT